MAFKPVLFSELKNYSRATFRSDLFAGITVGVVSLPMAMAFAIACGLSPEIGIFTAIVGGFLVAIFGGSKVQVSGPTGAFVVIIVSIIASYGFKGLVLSTLMAGVMLILLGAFRMGMLIKFVPFPVITGFTSGIALVIFSTQFKDILGLQTEMPASFLEKIGHCLTHLGAVNYSALGLTIFTVAAILISRRIWPKSPSMLIGMLAGTAASLIFSLDVETIGMRFGELPKMLPAPSLPGLDWSYVGGLFMPAATIALLAAIESLLSATVADGMTGDRHDPDTELIAQGIGNIGAVIFGGIPVTGAIARTATNVRCGAKTPVASIIHAITLLVILLLLGAQAKVVPLAALAGVMVVICLNMSEYHAFTRMFRGPKSDWSVMLITFFLTVLVDLVAAVMVGVALSILLFIRRISESTEVTLLKSQLEYDSHVASHDALSASEIPPGVAVFELEGPLFFGAVNRFQDLILGMLKTEAPETIILRMRSVPIIDATGLRVIGDFASQCRRRQINLILSGVRPQPEKQFRQYGLTSELGEDNICGNIEEALHRAQELKAQKAPDIG